MRADAFLDANVLLYAISTAKEEASRKGIACALMARADWGLSVQVLQEFYIDATRSPRPAVTHANAVAAIREPLRRPMAISDAPLLLAALQLRERYRLSYWNAAIVATAARALGAACDGSCAFASSRPAARGAVPACAPTRSRACARSG
jgi:predicted nucleic acid-binding protein